MEQQNLVFLGLGTNLGERRQQLQAAVDALGRVMTVDVISPLYESEPWGDTDQPRFLNACLAGFTVLSPDQLLCAVKAIEDALGRRTTRRWGPRLIDIDILFYGNAIVESADLRIPHPHIAARAFVLVPLFDIAPALVHPQTHQSIETLLRNVDRTPVRRVSGALSLPAMPDDTPSPCADAPASSTQTHEPSLA